MKTRVRGAAILHVLMLCAAYCGVAQAETARVQSVWTDRKIAVDGETAQWNAVAPQFSNTLMRITVRNDSEFLYLLATSLDKNTQVRVLARGLTYWYDPTGASRRAFGIRSPQCNRNPPLLRDLRTGTLAANFLARETAQSSASFDVVDDKGEAARTVYASQEDSSEVQSVISFVDSAYVQELRIPRALQGTPTDTVISIGIESCKPERSESSGSASSGNSDWGGGGTGGRGMHNGMGGGGGGGMGGHRAGGGGGYNRGEDGSGQYSSGEPRGASIALWFLVSLARGPASTNEHPAP